MVVCGWFRNNKMILSPEKCKALVLSRKPNVKLSLFAEGVALPLVDTVDLFGLDCKTVCIFAYSSNYARAVKQKVWNEAENREQDLGETVFISLY